MSVMASHIEGLMRGLGEDEMAGRLIKAVEGVEEKCMPLLTAMASEFHMPRNESSEALHPKDLTRDNQTMEDFGSMVSQDPFERAAYCLIDRIAGGGHSFRFCERGADELDVQRRP